MRRFRRFRLPPPSELPPLPSEQEIQEVLAANYAAKPSGIYTHTPLERSVVPRSVVDRNVGAVFERLWQSGGASRR